MIEVYADGKLVYNNRLSEYRLLGLKTTTGLNKSGTAELILPAGHPAYNDFISYRTVVELYENGVLQFRGRALYPADDFYNRRTITCEGERGFLRDGIIRPYLYEDDPAAIFAAALSLYNAEVDEFKRFTLGTVTVTDPNNYIRLESNSAETFAAFFDKLVERCGGYITFTDNGNGGRAINWLAEIGTQSDQAIEFGSNLLEFARNGQSPDLATAIRPYGAQLEDGSRVTIASVNNGVDYIVDEAAKKIRGLIMCTETWDDVTEPSNLLAKAKQRLAERRLAIVSLQLTAADLSKLGRDVGSYHDGDQVPVRSKPHDVDDLFQLTDRTVDWLNPAAGSVSLGKTQASLTGADVAGDRYGQSAVARVKREVTTEYTNAIANAVQASERTMTSRIEQSATNILLEVSTKYATSDQLTETRSQITQLADSISLEVSGGLGNSAAIRLNVNGETYTESMDLSEVRQAFADDPSAITISAGTITFNSGTLVINSSYFTLSSAGRITATGGTIAGWTLDENSLYKGTSFATASAFLCSTGSKAELTIAEQTQSGWVFKAGSNFGVTDSGALYCTDAHLSGTLITKSEEYQAKLSSGGLELFYDDGMVGKIDTRYFAGQQEDERGIALRLEGDGKYIMFCTRTRTSTGAYWTQVHYYLNNGMSSNYEETHIFQSSARFLDAVYFDGLYTHGVYLYEGYFIKACDSDGNVGEELLGYQTANSRVCLGSNYCDTLLRGSTVYLKNTSTTVTSDRNEKNSIEELPEAYEVFLDELQPVRFKYNDGNSGRYHVGFIAQDVEAALTAAGLSTQDFAGYVDVGFTGELGLQYTEFIAILLQKIKRLERQVAALQAA